MKKEVFIVAVARTPIGSFGGSLAGFTAPQLGSIAIKAVMERSGVPLDHVDEVLMGNVLAANLGQAPATQAALGAGLKNTTPCTLINKVCASGMKAVMLGAQAIQNGDAHIIVAGGMESMSNVPHYLPMRNGLKLGHGQLTDGLIKDGLWDVYNDFHMGNCGEMCADKYELTREDQDAYAIESYNRAQASIKAGLFDQEIVPVSIPQKKGDPIVFSQDEDAFKVFFDKIPTLSPVFKKGGTVTAANASNLNDGAVALMLASQESVDRFQLKPIARILSWADAAREPEWFSIAPADALPKALHKAKLDTGNLDAIEINEAFSSVALANNKILKLDAKKVNSLGGAVALGHPLGASGARIILTLLTALKKESGKFGAAAICNGGGGASAVVVELL
jgi:acetyl-CoA C-acetyltransferase